MKIGILTFHRPINYGAILQVTALQEYLNFRGEDAVVIDYRHPRIENDRRLIGSRCHKKRSIYANVRSMIRDIIEYHREKQLHDSFDHFMAKYLQLTKICDSNESLRKVASKMNILLVGSDLVWNWELDSELNEVFFLQFAKDLRCYKCSYASSIGSSKIPKPLEKKYSKYLENFNAISVREETAKDLLQLLVNKDIEVVLDPTLLLNEFQWKKFEEHVTLPKKYILIYLLEHSSDINNIVKYMVKKCGLPILFFDRLNIYKCKGKCVHTANPGQFLTLIKKAEFVITNSFHGTAFSILYKKSFFCIPHSSRGSRMIDLLNKLGLNSRIVRNVDDLEKELINPINYKAAYKKLKRYTYMSIEYMNNFVVNKKQHIY
ncbi:polysaccharide pyruvyl transferase family protein [Clostridium kluyveri]|uniref:polysaccharide pyruvyl transferase family protein n=1 Tax=Clostridium kluyveri TaxID=1534 RepID=UPI0022478632|nr:polysaccharide pyruvyl transferase family protein [Clostridium kluyveri]UZQ50361.1 polysaccharide pyruvyl transferase family protein [Clostridium kluyveri]